MCCKFKIAATMIGMTSETYGRIAMDIIVEKYISGKIIIVHQPRFFQQKKCIGPKWQKKHVEGQNVLQKIPNLN